MAWFAPHGEGIKARSVNESGIHTFSDKIVESLVRETVQNSLDVVVDETKPLIMTFDINKIQTNRIPHKEFFLNTAIPKAKKRWKHDEAAQEYLGIFERRLRENYTFVLKVSDFNTKGLEEMEWNALINDTGSSYKSDDSAGGSFGIGKSAPFAASYFRMLFYETLLRDGSMKNIGVTNFLSYEVDKYENGEKKIHTTEGTLYLGDKKQEPFIGHRNLGFNSRTEVGTDIFVIGFNSHGNWQNEIIKYTIKNFMVSIYDEKVVFKVGDKTVDKDSLDRYFQIFEDDADLKRTKKYYDVYNDPYTIKIGLDGTFKKYGFDESDAYFIVAEGKEANQRVLMSRKTGMQIFERSHISAVIQFNAIFRAEGKEINRVLRNMENPRHDKWVVELLNDEDKKKYGNLLDDFGRFFRAHINEQFKINEGEIIDAYGVSDFLPTDSEDDYKEDFGEDAINVILGDRKAKVTTKAAEDPESYTRDWERGNLGDGEKNDDGNFGEDSKGGGPKPPIDTTLEGTSYKNIRFKEIKNDTFIYKIIEQDYKKGQYRFMASSTLDREIVKVEMKIATETGDTYPGVIETVLNQDLEIHEDSNIYLEYLEANKSYFVDFELDENERIKLEARIYENK